MLSFVPRKFSGLPSRTLTREIVAAMLIKAVLLGGLWYLVFRYGGEVAKPNIDDLFTGPSVSVARQSSI